MSGLDIYLLQPSIYNLYVIFAPAGVTEQNKDYVINLILHIILLNLYMQTWTGVTERLHQLEEYTMYLTESLTVSVHFRRNLLLYSITDDFFIFL